MIGVLAQADVADHEQVGRGPLHGPHRLLHDPLLVVGLRAGRVLGPKDAEQDDAAEPETPGALGVLHELVHRGLIHAGQRRHFPAHALAVAHEQRPHELCGSEVGLLHQPPERSGAAQPAHAADRKVTHRPSNLDAPCAWSKPATATPAATGSRSSMSADAVSCTAPSRAVTRPYNRDPGPGARGPTYAATGAWQPPPSAASRPRSAATARALGACSSGASVARTVRSSARTSRPSAPRSGTTPSASPSANSVGRSLRECTATSIRPSRSASSISCVKNPFPSSWWSGRSTSASPRVAMTTSSAAIRWRANAARTHSACHRASALPRVPSLTAPLTCSPSPFPLPRSTAPAPPPTRPSYIARARPPRSCRSRAPFPP